MWQQVCFRAHLHLFTRPSSLFPCGGPFLTPSPRTPQTPSLSVMSLGECRHSNSPLCSIPRFTAVPMALAIISCLVWREVY